jgi:aminodeoxyfutalosine deaminase
MPSRQTLHARYVFPVVGAPIEHGFVSIDEGRIVEVGRSCRGGESLDLGNAAILPGFVNAHTHLEFSGLAQPLGTAGMGFVDWIREVIAWRRDHLLETQTSLAAGMRECSRQGVTTVGNISQWGEFENAYQDSVVDGARFFEVIATKQGLLTEVTGFLLRDVFDRRKAGIVPTWQLALSPHAPYSVDLESLKSLTRFSKGLETPLSMHLAESREEIEFVETGTGPFRDFLQERSVLPLTFTGETRPISYLKVLSKAHGALIIHGNYLNDAEIDYLGKNSAKMAVVYCPRTHAFFRHDRYPLEKMLAAGVTVALGTDSRASSPDLSLLAEMRFVAKQYPKIDRARILALGTIDGARALGRANEIGSVEPGKLANFAVVALADDAGDPYRLLLESDGQVTQTWFRGKCVANV